MKNFFWDFIFLLDVYDIVCFLYFGFCFSLVVFQRFWGCGEVVGDRFLVCGFFFFRLLVDGVCFTVFVQVGFAEVGVYVCMCVGVLCECVCMCMQVCVYCGYVYIRVRDWCLCICLGSCTGIYMQARLCMCIRCCFFFIFDGF